jgi:putative acetyltransferase
MIRRATADDVEAIVAVFESSFGTLEFVPKLHTHEENLAQIGRVVAEQDVFVYDEAGDIAGFVALDGDVGTYLYVRPGAFGHGVGSALLAEVKRQRSGGFTFWAFQANEQARRFDERRGCVAVRFTDGAGNEERTPDVLYEWRPG